MASLHHQSQQLHHSDLSIFTSLSLTLARLSPSYKDLDDGICCCCSFITKSSPTICDSMNCSPPGFSVHGISQARIPEWVAISFTKGIFQTQKSNPHLLHWQAGSLPLNHQGSPGKVKVKSLSRVWLFATPWTIANMLLRPWDFPGKSTEVGCHFLLQGIFPTQGSNRALLHCRQMLHHLSHQGSLRVGDYSGPAQIIQENHSISRHGTKHT